jgi:excinuclease ABC subunit A
MQFLPDVYIVCEACKGKRYNRDTLEVKYKGMSIADVLEMTVTQAMDFFDTHPQIKGKLRVLDEVGLDTIKLGQAATPPFLAGGTEDKLSESYQEVILKDVIYLR